ncbi:MAG: class III signal peptide-containing protein [Candidatus Diapherotrites archaeon]|nr:class III signal peptide-containing protein [Candidatus Diapherotrites archaeon]
MARSRAQGSIEYLLILGAVILVSAVVIGLLASMQYDDPKKSTVFASDAFSKLQHGNDAIIVTEGLADSSGDVILKLLGNSDSNVFVRNIRGNSAGDNSFDDVLILPQGEPVNFPLASFGDTCECTAGQTEINCDFVIAFMTDAGLRTQSLSSLIQCAQGNLDVLPPVINSSNPASLVFGTNSYILIFITNEVANCRYDTIFKTAFANMRYGFSGLLLSHSATITGLVTGDNNIYVKCKDVANNINQTDFNIKIIVSSPSIPLSTPFVWIVNNTGNNVSRLSISGGGMFGLQMVLVIQFPS